MICGWSGDFALSEGGREGTHCRNCASTSRHRAVVYTLGLVLGTSGMPLHEWPERRSVRLLESSARGPYPMIFRDRFEYFETEYDPAQIAAGKHPKEFADFQKLHYPTGHFDVVIASDVFEHVRDDRAGFSEVARVLKEGGALILTVPYAHDRAETIRRVDTSGTVDVMLLEPEYHGGGGHTLTYRNYGRDLLNLLTSAGLAVTHVVLDIPEYGITSQSVILARKGVYGEIRPGRSSTLEAGRTGMLFAFRAFRWYKYNLKGAFHFLKALGR